MENFSFIEYHQTRDFSRKMNATFEFIRQNFKQLSMSILFIAGPSILIASLSMGSIVGNFMNATINAGQSANANAMQDLITSVSFWAELGLAVLFFLLSTVMTIATINSYILLYEEKRSNRLQVREVWDKVRVSIGMYLGTTILYALLLMVAYIAVIIPAVMVATVSPFLIFLVIVGVLCLFTYLIVGSSMVFVIRAYEKKGFFEAIARSFQLIRGKWWSTFGLITVLYIIVVTASYIFMIPWYAMFIVNVMHNVESQSFQEPSALFQTLTIVAFTLYYVVQMVLYAMPNIGIAFQYFNLVERKEARGLMNQIETIGQAPSVATSDDEQY